MISRRILLALVILLIGCAVLISCDQADPPESNPPASEPSSEGEGGSGSDSEPKEEQCNHSFGKWRIRKHPCVEVGEEWRFCSLCGERETREVAATGEHLFEYWFLKKKPCVGEGIEQSSCDGCDEIAQRTVPAVPDACHSFDAENKCEVCREEYVDEGLLFSDGMISCGVYGYTGTNPVVRIPHKYKGLPVTYMMNEGPEGGDFQENPAIVELIIGDNVKTLGNNGNRFFVFSPNLKRVVLGKGITHVGEHAFLSCKKLEEVVMPSVQTIDIQAFNNCESLKSVTFSSSLQSIGKYAFSACGSLSSITLPLSLQGIGEMAFYGCENLKTVYNQSSLTLTAGLTDHGYVAYYAETVRKDS